MEVKGEIYFLRSLKNDFSDEKSPQENVFDVLLKELQTQFNTEQFLKRHVFEIRSLKRPSKADLI